MPAYKRYKSAPIVEAVIELRVAPGGVNQEELRKLVDSWKTQFPKRAAIRVLEMGIGTQQGQAISQSLSQAVIGFRLAKPDDSRVLQIRNEGLAYSHMAPYTEWAIFRAEGEPLWKQYRSVCLSAKFVRCALRYINRIDIPERIVEPSDYFALYPNVPKALPQQDVIGMEMSLRMPQHDLGCAANINYSMLGEPVKKDHISFILDIDVFRLGIEDWTDEQVWEYLDKLRERKNEIFEACITDRTRELIDK